jgi:head-tail adaptor
MTTGELRERVRIDRRAAIPDDGYGNTQGAWAEFIGPVAARIAPAAGSEDVLAERLQGLQPVEITIRYSRQAAAIQTQDRAVNVRSGKTYNVTSINNADERRAYLSILATAGGADG